MFFEDKNHNIFLVLDNRFDWWFYRCLFYFPLTIKIKVMTPLTIDLEKGFKNNYPGALPRWLPSAPPDWLC